MALVRSLSLAWIAAVAACATTVADDAISVCQPLCRCGDIPQPGEQRDCVDTCVAQFEAHPLGEACVVCVVGHGQSCAALTDACADVCLQAAPLLPSRAP